MHHYITKYESGGIRYAEAWFQVNLFGRSFCVWRVKTKI